jgi:hypothetical protein
MGIGKMQGICALLPGADGKIPEQKKTPRSGRGEYINILSIF